MRTSAALCTLILSVAACGGGGSTPSPSHDANATPTTDAPTESSGATEFTAEPVQLAIDPCLLVTKTEAEALIGPVGDASGSTFDPPKCIYVSSQNTGGQLAVSLVAPDFCKFLFLALDKNMFGGVQVRVDDVGDGGMLVKGEGNVQFVVDGGCIEVDGSLDHTANIDDDTVLRLARTAAERATA